jgi:lysophospholipase L1-like esterase
MNENSRRGFIKGMALTGLATTTFSGLGILRAAEIDSGKRKAPNGMVILFQGDSITDGNRGRNNDPNHIMGHGYAFSIASRLGADYPEKRMVFYNRGISGNKASDLENRWQTDILDLKPDVLSILVGVNDSSSVVFHYDPAITVEMYEKAYSSLLQRSMTLFPDIVFVLCEPFILPVGRVKENWDAYLNDLSERRDVVKKLAVQYKAVYVGFQDVFTKACERAPADYWIWDGVHPTVAGHELMAREWLKCVSKRIAF